MTRLHLPGSPGAAIHNALALLPAAVLDAIGLTADTLYAIANPRQRIKLGLIESAKLDAALIALGHAPLFLPLYTEQRHMTLTQLGGEPQHAPADLRDRLTAAVSALGDLADEITGAKCPGGDGGAAITLAEAKALLTQAERLQTILTHLRRDVHAKCPGATNTGNRQ
ncbi:hypothetical protein [Elstera cyanobacteriorum]|uniref:hypothetical protein n=1 Tax=Elstera cyanobacteriorum TaxID=2022747 RepID=UPI0023542410|nr:hypothetical protein [Elstera cyanobacteriorum]MCK6442305.1 hypothetical protein [Elstera cyanobacteriorum]